jgi:hypothetical protein
VLAFLQGTVLPKFGGDRKIYLIWDNFSAHKRALNLWMPKPANVEFFWTPTHASWLNLIEPLVPGAGENRSPQYRSQNHPARLPRIFLKASTT